MAGDWIKLHRSIMAHWVFADDALFYLWSNLLLRANWKDGKFWPGGSDAPLVIKRGQLVTGRNKLHAMLYPELSTDAPTAVRNQKPKPHPTTLWRWLEAMQKDGMIKMDVRKHFTIITICNYESYQNHTDDDAPSVRHRRASGAQAVRQPCASGAPTVRTIEEETKKERMEEGKKENLLPGLLQTETFVAAWRDWEQHRKEIKHPLKPTMAVAQLKMLSDWGHDRAVAAIRHTIAMGWQGLKEPDTQSNGKASWTPPKI